MEKLTQNEPWTSLHNMNLSEGDTNSKRSMHPSVHSSTIYNSQGAFSMAQWVKNLPAMQEAEETWVRSLGWEDPLEKDMATHSSILAWKIPWTEEPAGLQSTGHRVRHG